jgi:multidrug efflux pump subunit AcrA (membrane-fusion protein)
MKKVLISILVAILLVALAMGISQFLTSQKELPKKEHKEEKPKNVKVVAVKYENIQSNIVSSGRVLSKNIVKLSSEVSGKILEGDVPFKKSQSFKQGDVLLRIYDENFKNMLKAKKSSFLQLISNILPDIKIDYADSYNKWKNFFNNLDIEKPLPELPSVNSEKEKIYLANRNILTTYYNLKSDELTFSKYTVRAPFNGSYTNVLAEVGSIAGMGSPLANIISTGGLEIEAPVKVEKASFVKIGDRVKITHPNGNICFGNVVRKSKFVNENTQSVNCFIKFNNAQILAGMYLKVEFGGIDIPNAMELRRSILVNNNKVWVVKDSALHLQELNIVKKHTENFIFNEIPEGTLVVVSPLLKPYEGQKVVFESETVAEKQI